MAETARHVFVRGRVQGVAFRWATARRAARHGLNGWVRNLADGRVETWIQGEPEAVDAMLAWLESGPTAARVDDVTAHEVDPVTLDDFEIRHTAMS